MRRRNKKIVDKRGRDQLNQVMFNWKEKISVKTRKTNKEKSELVVKIKRGTRSKMGYRMVNKLSLQTFTTVVS